MTDNDTDVRASIEDIEVFATDLDVAEAASIYRRHGCLVVRGLMLPYLEAIQRDIEATAKQAIALLEQAKQVPEGWVTPDGTLFIPAPAHYGRSQQIMVLAVNYYNSGAFLQAACDQRCLDVVEAIIGPDIELFINGQCLYKEPVGGHPKHLHQDSAYFEHRFEGPVGVLNYVVDTDLVNGALYVVPGSHLLGQLGHIDTFSHLGLSDAEWPWERALPVIGSAGDSIFFHVRTVHGSRENHSEQPRPVFINRYRRADDYVVVGGSSVANRADSEKRAAMATKENQRGLMVRGYRKFETATKDSPSAH